jgi:hypothetical protein
VEKTKKAIYDKVYQKKYRARLRKQHAEYYKKYREEHKQKSEAYRLLRLYHLTLEQIDNMLIAQNHKCAICGKLLTETKRCIDHSHTTGKVRGILCVRCNTGLWAVEDEEFRKLALTYLGGYHVG